MKITRLCLFAALLLALTRSNSLGAQQDGQQFASLGEFRLASGQTLHDLRLGYRTLGTLNAQKSNVILAATWYGGTTAELKGNACPGCLFDTSKYFVVLIDALGNGVSSSPSNSERQPRMSFPRITIRDMVDAEHELATRVLHLDHVKAVMGISMGGMQTFQWIVSYPGFMDKAVPIVGSPRLTAFDLMHWEANNEAIEADPAWKNGDYASLPPLTLSSRLNDMMMSTPARFDEQHTREEVLAGFKTPHDNATDDPDNHIRQAEAMMSLDVSDLFGGDMGKAAAAVKAKVLVIPAAQDHMVSPGPALDFAKRIGAEVLLLESNCGHMATGCESEKINTKVHEFLHK